MTGAMRYMPCDAVPFASYRGVKMYKREGPRYYCEQYGVMQIAFTLKFAMFLIDMTLGGHDGL